MTSTEDHLFWRSAINERDLQTNRGEKKNSDAREERRGEGEEMCAKRNAELRRNTRFQQTVDEQPPH
jgi:hypothetical protein